MTPGKFIATLRRRGSSFRRLCLPAALLSAVLIFASHVGAKTVPLAHFARPPMGWDSWNSFSNTIDSRIVVAQAHAMVNSGMHAAGYKYIVIDEGWWRGKRNANGNIRVNPQQWPALAPGEKAGNMANIARFLHHLGLKAGIYTDAGPFGCGYPYPDIGPHYPNTGSLGYYDQDMQWFAKKGFDYIKIDWCGGYSYNLDPAVQYAQLARAIERARIKTGHSIYFSICEWGRQSPWTWAAGVGGITADMWRTGGDITPPIVDVHAEDNRRVGPANVFKNFDAGLHPEGQHTGYYNDMDMMVVGMRGMTLADDRLHMSLWAISGAPLIVGSDLTKLNKAEVAVLINRQAVAIDQDPMGVQCINVGHYQAGLQAWAKPMPTAGVRAVVLLNRTKKRAAMTMRWRDIGLDARAGVDVRDVWAHRNLGVHKSTFTANVGPQNMRMFLVSGRSERAKIYRPYRKPVSHIANGALGQGAYNPADIVAFHRMATQNFSTYIEVNYINRTKFPIIARLQRMFQMRF